MEVRSSLIRALNFTSILWTVHLFNIMLGGALCDFGVSPREIVGLPGIFLSPFLHGSVFHIFANSLMLAPLLFVLYDAYGPKHTNAVLWQTILLSGTLLWMFGRGGVVHIGVSGVVYSLFAYLPASAIRYRKTSLLLVSIPILLFCGGGMLKDMFTMSDHVSWEAHLTGAVTGVMLAIFEERDTPILKEEKGDDDEDRSHCIQSGRPPQNSGMAAKEMEFESSD